MTQCPLQALCILIMIGGWSGGVARGQLETRTHVNAFSKNGTVGMSQSGIFRGPDGLEAVVQDRPDVLDLGSVVDAGQLGCLCQFGKAGRIVSSGVNEVECDSIRNSGYFVVCSIVVATTVVVGCNSFRRT